MVIVDQRGSMVAVNREAERLFGWTDAELRGEPSSRFIAERFQRLYDALDESDDESCETAPKRAPVRIFARRRDGGEFPVEIHRRPLGPSEDALFLVTMRDLTEWRDVQESLFRQKEQAIVALASIAEAVITTDLAGRITFLNPTEERLTGWRTTEALGQPADTVLALITDATRQPMESISARCLREGRAVDLADGVLLLRRGGTEVPIGGSAAPLRDRHGATTGVVLVLHDVTERRRAARKLSHEATHDALTGLVARKEFEDRLARVLAEAAAGVVEHALCYLDLDRFKLVNDTCGHEAGDDLLRRISQLLSSRLRSRDTLARLGGDEFGVLLEYCSLTKAAEIAGKLERAIEEFRCVWGERSFSLGVSIGVVAITAASGRTADVLRAADEACYAAKDAGGNRVHVAQPEAAPGLQQQVESRRIIRLSRAVDEGHFELYAQAIVPLAPEALCFEIAEAAALGNFAQLVRLISEIRATGCGVGLDNFGNSLASFAHLKALSVDYVKIGGHYVRGVADDPVYGTLVRAVNEIGRIMGITTIAEEVESETILQKLRGLGVGYAQGHAVASPAPLVDRDGQVALAHVRRPG